MTKQQAIRRVTKQKVVLMNDPRTVMFSAVIMMCLFHVVDKDHKIKTGATDGLNVYLNIEFIRKLTDAQLRYLIMHEVMHVAFKHMTVWRALFLKCAMSTNLATDNVINLTMKYEIDPSEKFLEPIEGGICDDKYYQDGRVLDTKKIFDDIFNGSKSKQGGGNGEATSGDSEQGDQDQSDSSKGQTLDDHMWEEAKARSDDPNAQEALDQRIEEALRQGKAYAEMVSAKVARSVTEILEPKINWRDMLRSFISNYNSRKDVSSWRRPNRRWVSQDIIMPSLVSENAGPIVIGVDTSGSVSQKQISAFLGEISAICKDIAPEKIDLMYWDGEVYTPVETYQQSELENLIASTKVAGGGGTDPSCVSRYINDNKMRPQSVIMFTDGYVPNWGSGWNCPVFWGITDKHIQADNGTSVHVDVEV